jgi:hypothetical protein
VRAAVAALGDGDASKRQRMVLLHTPACLGRSECDHALQRCIALLHPVLSARVDDAAASPRAVRKPARREGKRTQVSVGCESVRSWPAGARVPWRRQLTRVVSSVGAGPCAHLRRSSARGAARRAARIHLVSSAASRCHSQRRLRRHGCGTSGAAGADTYRAICTPRAQAVRGSAGRGTAAHAPQVRASVGGGRRAVGRAHESRGHSVVHPVCRAPPPRCATQPRCAPQPPEHEGPHASHAFVHRQPPRLGGVEPQEGGTWWQ